MNGDISIFVSKDNHAIDPIAFRSALIAWGANNFRPFPWRTSHDPYELLIAEVMLHRTQAKQVVPVYQKFLADFPDLKAAGGASRTILHEYLYPLGLCWRIDLIFDMFAVINTEHKGHVPFEKSQLMSLPGVNDYAASAVRCFAWNLPEPLVDTNTVRVIGRLFNLEIKDSSRRNKEFRRLITELVDPENPRNYNYALLDLAWTSPIIFDT